MKKLIIEFTPEYMAKIEMELKTPSYPNKEAYANESSVTKKSMPVMDKEYSLDYVEIEEGYYLFHDFNSMELNNDNNTSDTKINFIDVEDELPF